MREFVIVLLVIAVLFGLTALRYRKQIAGAFRIWRMLRDARGQMRESTVDPHIEKSSKLVSCSKCGTWIPESTAIRMGPTIFYCSRKCLGQIVEAR